MTTRRDFMLGGCLAVAAASLPSQAATGHDRPAPRLRCLHEHCRHHRPGHDRGRCALALNGSPLFGPDSLQELLTEEMAR